MSLRGSGRGMVSGKNFPEVALMAFGGCGNNAAEYFRGKDSSDFLFVQVDNDEESHKRGGDIRLSYADCEDSGKLASLFPGLRLFFLVGGLGGSACEHMPAVARALTAAGALGVGLLTTPFPFENRKEKADRDLRAIVKEVGRVCLFPNTLKKGDDQDSRSLARRMGRQAEGMWLCIDAMTNKRTNPEKYDLEDLNRLVPGGEREIL